MLGVPAAYILPTDAAEYDAGRPPARRQRLRGRYVLVRRPRAVFALVVPATPSSPPRSQVMELASRDLSAVIAHDHVCGRERARIQRLPQGGALVLRYLQRRGLAHCDIKPRNLGWSCRRSGRSRRPTTPCPIRSPKQRTTRPPRACARDGAAAAGALAGQPRRAAGARAAA